MRNYAVVIHEDRGRQPDSNIQILDPRCAGLKSVTGWSLSTSMEVTIYSKPGERKASSIPVHGRKSLKAGLGLRIARDAGVDI